ncbi:hypothetical protein Efla_003695 [Eimeria flavescens]
MRALSLLCGGPQRFSANGKRRQLRRWLQRLLQAQLKLQRDLYRVEELLQARRGKQSRVTHSGNNSMKRASLTSFEHTLEQLNLLSSRASSRNSLSSNSSTTGGAAGRRRRQDQQPTPVSQHQSFHSSTRPPVPRMTSGRMLSGSSNKSSNSAARALLLQQQQQLRESETCRLQQQLRHLERQVEQQREDQQKQQQLQLQMQMLQMQQLQILQYRHLGASAADVTQQHLLLPQQQPLQPLQQLLPQSQPLAPQQHVLLQPQLLQQMLAQRQQQQPQQSLLAIQQLQQQLLEQQLGLGASLQQLEEEPRFAQQQQQNEQQQQQQEELLQNLRIGEHSDNRHLSSSVLQEPHWATGQSLATSTATGAKLSMVARRQASRALAQSSALPEVIHGGPAAATGSAGSAAEGNNELAGLLEVEPGAAVLRELGQQQMLLHQLDEQQQQQEQEDSEDIDVIGACPPDQSPLEAAAHQELLQLQHERAKLIAQQHQFETLQHQLLEGGSQQQLQLRQRVEEQQITHDQAMLLHQLQQLQRRLRLEKLQQRQLQQQQGESVALSTLDRNIRADTSGDSNNSL